MKIRSGGQWREIVTGKAFKSGAWRTLTIGKAYINGAWRDIANFVQAISFVFAVGPDGTGTTSVGGRDDSSTIVTDIANTIITGGLAPFTYAWTITSFTGASSLTIATPSAASTRFTASGVDVSGSGVAHCVITDSLGSTASGDLNITFTNTTASSGG